MKLFIDDGYNVPGYVKAEPGLYPELRFVYRPCLHEERTQYWDWESRHEALQLEADRAAAVGDRAPRFKLDPLAKTVKRAELLAAHLVSWQAPAPLNAAWVRKLHPNLLDRAFRIVLGVDPPDEDPLTPAPLPQGGGEGMVEAAAKN